MFLSIFAPSMPAGTDLQSQKEAELAAVKERIAALRRGGSNPTWKLSCGTGNSGSRR